MTKKYDLSPEAEHVLDQASYPLKDRSVDNLRVLRVAAKASISPAVEKVLNTHQVKTDIRHIRGIPCMRIYPIKPRVKWKIFYGFGGGYVSGSPFEDLTITAPLAAKTGAMVVVPNYRLAPEHPWPAAIDDGLLVFKALSEEPFAIVGESAGGNLCLALMLRAKQLRLPLPSAAVFLSPWCDLTNSGDSLNKNDGRDPVLSAQHIEFAAKHYVGDNDPENPMISPINGLFDETFPPSLITTGSRDLLLSQSSKLADMLSEKGISVDLRVWEDLWHVFEWDDQLPEAQKSLTHIADFLLGHMG